MDSYLYFLKEGFLHITDQGAYDHILFIAALAILYHIKQWKQLLAIVTTFTIGHSIALGLATFKIIKVDSSLVEFLIPVTIILTCLWNIFLVLASSVFHVEQTESHKEMFHVEQSIGHYFIIIVFGLIHGLGFSNYLRFMLTREETIFMPLLTFNIGLELGQIIILILVLILNFVSLKILPIHKKHWIALLSLVIIYFTIPILIAAKESLFI